MPARGVVPPLVGLVLVPEHLAPRHAADVADLVVPDAELGRRVEHRVDVQRRARRLAREQAEPLYERLLQLVGEVVLRAEEDHAALGD